MRLCGRWRSRLVVLLRYLEVGRWQKRPRADCFVHVHVDAGGLSTTLMLYEVGGCGKAVSRCVFPDRSGHMYYLKGRLCISCGRFQDLAPEHLESNPHLLQPDILEAIFRKHHNWCSETNQ